MFGIEGLISGSAGLKDCAAWAALERHADEMAAVSIAALLDQPGRFAECSRSSGRLLLDFSRNRISGGTLELLIELAHERRLPDWIDAMFSGRPVNNTEGRAALHTALRSPDDATIMVDGHDVMSDVVAEREKVLSFAAAVRSGRYAGHGGAPLTDVVNIGIGGSDLGLVMVAEALRPFAADGLRTHFVSNIDGCQLADVLARVRPATTLFIICSKSFSTLETQLNADAARSWFLDHMPAAAIGRHFVAVSVNDEAMDRFGIAPENRFRIWDWVGGRYSLWSAIGLSLAIALGEDHFRALLQGAHEMDRHFRDTTFADNLPVLLALIGIWNRNFQRAGSHVILPYDQRLHRLPAFLQQLDMESNGKSVTRDGRKVEAETGPVIWGEPGSNAQHSFFQLLHQGTISVSMDFIAPARGSSPYDGQHRDGLANMLAQAEALARGRSAKEVDAELSAAGMTADERERLVPHRVHPGNRPGNILLCDALTPATLGALVALYEHKVFVQSVIWGINAFDQWGVELGKKMASRFGQALAGSDGADDLPDIAVAIRDWRTD